MKKFPIITLSGKIDNSGTLSKNDFWKIKKKLFPKSQSVPHAVLDKLGNELTDPKILFWHVVMKCFTDYKKD